MREQTENRDEEVIAGRNAVHEAIKSGREIECLLVARGERSGSAGVIIAACRDKGIPVKEVSPMKLDMKCPGVNHQGMVAVAAAHTYAELEDVFALAESRNEKPFLIICDEIEDPHNLGAIVRTAEATGVHGIIIPKRRNVGLTYSVSKAACGALEYMNVVRVPNLPAVIEDLKKRGVWIYGAVLDGEPWCTVDYSGGTALVIGSEGNGIGRLVSEKCDFYVTLPMAGEINSLNASVAASVLMYEVARQRKGIKAKG